MSLLSIAIQQIQLPPWTFEASQRSRGVQIDGIRTSKEERLENRRKAIAAFTERGPMSSVELAEAIGVDPKVAAAVVIGLIKSKDIWAVADKMYDIRGRQ